jgi:alkylated DNA repair dioxygenase AlkB
MRKRPPDDAPGLFDAAETLGRSFETLDLPDAEVLFYPHFFTGAESDALFAELHATIPWKQEKIKLYDKVYDVPRLTAWHGDEGKSYTYSGIKVDPYPWTPPLLTIKKAVEAASGVSFNSVLLNLYRDGKDSVSWHSDDEPELGKNPVIGSVSLGATRTFQLRHKKEKELLRKVRLGQGSYLLMKGPTQHFWVHQISKEAGVSGARINLTFRIIH